MGDDDKKTPAVRGRTGARATVVLAPPPPDEVVVRIESVKGAEAERFIPLATGKDTVTVHYALEPASQRMDQVTITIKDASSEVVFERVYTKKDKTAEAAKRSKDDGKGCDFVWDGREQIPKKGYKGPRPHVSTRRGPFTITIAAELRGVAGASDAERIVATPLIDKAVVVSRVGAGDFDDTNKLLANADVVEILGLVRAAVKEPADQEWFVVAPATAGQAKLGKTKVAFAVWDEATFGALEVEWQKILPRKNGRGIMGHKDVNRQNNERKTTEGEYTNVVSNGAEEGKWIGLDTLEYEHTDAGEGPSPDPDTEDGTVRWHFEVDYEPEGLRLGTRSPGSPGRHDGTAPTEAIPVKSGVASSDYAAWGIANTVHRTSRRGTNADRYLSFIEAYKRVPWIYGSIDPQVLNFVGFDCADLMFGAAIKAELTKQRAFTNANNLCRTAKYTTRRAKLPIMYLDAQKKFRSVVDDSEVAIPFGTTPDTVNLGDIVFFDWDGTVNDKGAGKWHHTTVVWSCPSGTFGLDTQLVQAHHSGVALDKLGDMLFQAKFRFAICSWT